MSVIEPRVYSYYKSVVCQDVIYTHDLRNIMELPKIIQCVFNSSSAAFLKDKARGLAVQTACSSISGQRSAFTRAHKSIATFQLKKGSLLGCTVNLRGAALYSFLDQYITLACSPLHRQALPVGERPTAVEKTQGSGWRIKSKSRQHVDHNFGGGSFTFFPGIEAHFLAFSAAGGFHCTLSVAHSGGLGLPLAVLTALQIPL